MVWVTHGKEIENYTPKQVWERVIGKSIEDIGEYDGVMEILKENNWKKDKVQTSHEVVKNITFDDLENHLDLQKNMSSLLEHIRRWNKLGIE